LILAGIKLKGFYKELQARAVLGGQLLGRLATAGGNELVEATALTLEVLKAVVHLEAEAALQPLEP
jgi:hypothetical protein